MEVLRKSLRREQLRKVFRGKILRRRDGEHEAVIVRCGDGVAAAQSAQAQGDDAGQGFVTVAPNQAVEEVMAHAALEPAVAGLVGPPAGRGGKSTFDLNRLR